MDRLSELPDSVIFHIFWMLPMDDVIRTTILSKRWKDLWTISPFLNIDDDALSRSFETTNEFRNFVYRALSCWNGVRILKFNLVSYNEKPIHGDMDVWVRFAKKYEVKELYLHMTMESLDFDSVYDQEKIWVPQFLYSCSSLQKLRIQGCGFRNNGNVQWNQLKSLTIVEGFGVTEHVMNQILSGSPKLEVLKMSFVYRGESLCIRSTSLKELSVRNEPYILSKLRIWTPNLESLKMNGVAYSKCFLMNVSSLTHATLGFSGLHQFDNTYGDFCGINGFSSANHFFGDLYGRILPSIQQVEDVTLVSCCVKVLGAMIEKCMDPSSSKVKSLQLRFDFHRYTDIVGIIEIFPQLKRLVLRVTNRDWDHGDENLLCDDAKSYLNIEANLPKSFVLQLRTIEVTLVEGENIFPLLEFLLKYASKLEKMAVKVKGIRPPSSSSNSLLLASQKLLKMPRSSRAALFTFCEY